MEDRRGSISLFFKILRCREIGRLSEIPDAAVVEDDSWRERAAAILQLIRLDRAWSILFPSRFKVVKNLTYSLKNSIYLKNSLSSGCSNALSTHFPPFSSTVYRLLEKGGAVFICSSAHDELGMGGLGIYSNRGILHSAFSEARACGGSSSGGAFLVRRGIVDFSVVTDTGGSSRLPSSFNSVCGFKPSFGKISREGILPLCTLFDTPSIISYSIELIARVFSVLSQKDPNDLSTVRVSPIKYHVFSKNPLNDMHSRISRNRKLKISFLVLKDLFDFYGSIPTIQERKVKSNFLHLISRIKGDNLCEVYSIGFGWPPLYLSELVYIIVAYGEIVTNYLGLNGIFTPWTKKPADSNELEESESEEIGIKQIEVEIDYRRKFKKIRSKMGREVVIRHLVGYFFLYRSNYFSIYLQARRLLTLYRKRIKELTSDAKIILSPTSFCAAPLLSSCTRKYTPSIPNAILLLSNFGGLPAISIPWLHFQAKADSSRVYFGLHLTTREWEDKYLLSSASFLIQNGII